MRVFLLEVHKGKICSDWQGQGKWSSKEKKKSKNAKIVGILTGHGLCSTEDVRNFLSEQVTVKGHLEAEARSLTEKLVAEEERADNAKTAAYTGTRKVEQEHNGYPGEIAKRDADISGISKTQQQQY